mgnify:FL=1|jgi:hypothetical protein|tara:strand:- start:95 stop:817 length:723 start_codon:yes stop_codon:yes gene_type:complete
MIDRTMWFLYNRLGDSGRQAPSIDSISEMFFNYWKIMNAININTQTLSAIDIYNGLSNCYDNLAKSTARNLYEDGEVAANADYRVSYYEQNHDIYDVYANCVNLNEVLLEGADPEFDDTDSFREALDEVAYEDMEYEIESETFTLNEDTIEWYKTVHPSDDKIVNYMYDTGESLEWDDIQNFLYDKLNTIQNANADMHQSQIRKFMLDRLANQNINIIDGLEQTENGMKEVDPNTGELQD